MYYDDEIIEDNKILDQIEELSDKLNRLSIKNEIKNYIKKLRLTIQIGINNNNELLKSNLISDNYTECIFDEIKQKYIPKKTTREKKKKIETTKNKKDIDKIEKNKFTESKIKITDNKFDISKPIRNEIFNLKQENTIGKETIICGNSDNSLTSFANESFLIYLIDEQFLNIPKFCSLLSKKIKNQNILQYSELIITSLITAELFNIKNIQIIGVDTPFYEYIGEERFSFRCDIVFLYLDELYIIENKYAVDKCLKGIDAHKCLTNRLYPNRILFFLKYSKREYFTKIKKVIEIGICLNIQSDIDTYYVKRDINNYVIEGYYNGKCLNQLKKRKIRK